MEQYTPDIHSEDYGWAIVQHTYWRETANLVRDATNLGASTAPGGLARILVLTYT
jgi:hypothetical protein